ncbi:MAG: hypothetical protein S4CHLAM6_03110 [Chlamydiae bacterium]|nr:hypothetical protein [Chlamydiota bacterium]
MSSSSSQSSIGLLFDVQALNRLNESQRKQDEKRKHQVKSDEISLQQSDKEDDKLKKKRSDGKDIISRRRNVARAMSKRASKNGKSSKKSKTQDTPVIAKKTKTAASAKTGKASKPSKTSKGKNAGKSGRKNAFNEAQIKGLGLIFNQHTKIQLRAQAEEWPELKLDLKKNVLDQILDRKNLKDCKLTDKQLEKAKHKARGYSRAFRKIGMKAWKPALNTVAKGYAKHGVDITNPEHKSNPDIDQSIFASILDSIEVNQLLQKLGIKTEIVEMDVQDEMGKEMLSDSKKVYSKNADAIKESHDHSCKAETLKILGDVFGAILCASGLPQFGIPMILAANGDIQKMIAAVAKFMNIPPYVVQSIIVTITLIIAITVAIASEGTCTGLCVAAVLFVAGMTGWLTNTVGAIATGQFDPSKFPGWVCWAVMGINIGMILLTCGDSLTNLVRSVGSALSAGAAMAADGISSAASSAMEYISSVFGDTESLASDVGVEMDESLSLGDDGAIEEGSASEGGEPTSAKTPVPAAAQASASDVVEPAAGAIPGDPSASVSMVASETPASVAITMSESGGAQAVDETAQGVAALEDPVAVEPTTTGAAQAEVSPTTANAAAVRTSFTEIAQDMALDGEEDSSQAITSVSKASAPEGTPEATTSEAEEGTDTRTMKQKALSALRRMFTKMLAKLVKIQRSITSGLSADAAEASAIAKGGESAAQTAENITKSIARVMRMLQKISRWMMLLDQGAQAIVEFEIARNDDDLAATLKEIAQLTGETELVEQFVSTFNMAIKATKQGESQHAKDSASEFELLGAVVSTQRRNNNMLMSA